MSPSYAELHCLTNFTFLRGASHAEELVERAARLGYSALAITDECSLAGVVRAHVAAKEHGIRLIVGSEIELQCETRETGKRARGTRREAQGSPPSPRPSPSRGEGEPLDDSILSSSLTPHAMHLAPGADVLPSSSRRGGAEGDGVVQPASAEPPRASLRGIGEADGVVRLVLLAADREGYGNLSELITRGRRRSRKGEYRLTPQDLDDGLPGCLALLLPGTVPDPAQSAWLKARFPRRCWIAAELLYGASDAERLAVLDDFARACDLPLVAAGDVHMHVRGRRALQDTLTAIRVKRPLPECGDALFPNGERHLRSRERLLRIYPPELLIATIDVAERCTFSLDELRYEYPEEIVPDGETPASWLRKLAQEGFRWRFGAELEEQTEGEEHAVPPLPSRERAGMRDTDERCAVPPLPSGERAGVRDTDMEHAVPPRPSGERAGVRGKVGERQEAGGSSHHPAGLFPSSSRRGGAEGDGVVRPTHSSYDVSISLAASTFSPPDPPLTPALSLEGRGGTARLPPLASSLPPLASDLPSVASRRSPPASRLSPLTSRLPPPAPSPQAANGWGGHFTAGQKIDIAKARALVEHELALIAELRYEPYFLTVYDVVRFARSQGILCQGRGSAANSAVCYCLGVTEVDPARMEMLFERFISKERNEPPDIDVDFEHERREEVIQYIYGKYGRERAAIAATVISYRSKSAVRDIGKALGLDLAQVDRLAKNLAWGDVSRIRAERIRECGFDPDSPVIRRLLALVHVVIGFPRHLSQHVGGFVISRGPVSRLVPIENAAMPERTIIQWDKDDLDALGLLKVDVLALGMLTAIRRALALVSETRGHPFGMSDVPPEDPGVYEMVGRADTIGVFQIESRAQQAMLPRMRPKCFYDLVIEVAIVRPGPIQGGMIHPYLRRRSGLEPVTYPSDAVRGVLERTLGVPIFQEQVMQLAIAAAGFTPGEADKLRRAMAAWKRRGGLEPFEKRLKDGMRERGYSEDFAQQIFRQILGFGEYGFPESHSASFALLVYVSCWLKCYEPAAFTCALLNSQPMGFYAPAQLVQDAQRHGVEVQPPDVLVSGWDCTLESDHPAISTQPAIRLGLRMVKGLSKEAAERLVAARERLLISHPGALLFTPHPGPLPEPSPYPLPQAGEGFPLSWERGNTAVHRECSSFSHSPGAEKVLLPLDESRGEGCRSPSPLQGEGRGEGGLPQASHLAPGSASNLSPRAPLCSPSPLEGEGRGEGGLPRALTFEQLALAANLNRHDVNALAAAGALATITGHRRQAAWDVTGIHERPPVLAGTTIDERVPQLARPSEADDIVADYATLGLTLGRHPVALLRPRLARMRMVTAAQLRDLPHGRLTRAAGLVIGRQRPDTASGVIFVTLEDETGMVNVVVWRTVSETQRRELLGSHLLAVHGVVERQGDVVHLVAGRLVDHTHLLGRLLTHSRDFH